MAAGITGNGDSGGLENPAQLLEIGLLLNLDLAALVTPMLP